MTCPKCQGPMIYEAFKDFLGTENVNLFKGWRCLVYGIITDRLTGFHKNKNRIAARTTGKRRSRRSKRLFAN